jgi:hypothetical protein
MTRATDIERRLRLPAPDEPASLPALLLPVETRSLEARLGRRIGARRAPDLRLAVAVVALLALLTTVLVAGALRPSSQPLSVGTSGCVERVVPDLAPDPAATSCYTLTIPSDWHVLAAGEISEGDFSQPDIAYERVELLVANVELGGCATVGGPIPTAVEESDGTHVMPLETADPGLACLSAAALPKGGVRVRVLSGTRITGLVAPDGPAISDTSEPSVAAGWTEHIDGRPARHVVDAKGETWDILFPGSIERIVRVQAEISSPDDPSARAALKAMVESIDFVTDMPSLAPDGGAGVLASTIDSLVAGGREQGTDFYACLPRAVGSRAGTITGGPSRPLAQPLDVTCDSAISASSSGLWRITLDVRWPAAEGHAAGGLREELFVLSDPSTGTTSSFRSLDGRPIPAAGIDALLPGGGS